uniref:carbamoyltransferase C-terminal domain-containing protein n=1 Tax=Flavobacterium sp. TaxID=239 RepID=UPI0040492D88
MKNKPIYIIGTATSHDGSTCLLKDGKIIYAIEKERITRRKHDGYNDNQTIQYCLDAEGISLNEISLIVQNDNFSDFRFGNDSLYEKRLFSSYEGIPVKTISHHLAHAYSAIGTCPFNEFDVLVMDGCGSPFEQCIDKDGIIPDLEIIEKLPHLFMEKDSFYHYDGKKINTIYKDFSEWGLYGNLFNYPMYPLTTKHSIGGMYDAVSRYCFGDVSDPGKLMGLSPYGKSGFFNEGIFQLKDGRVFVNYQWISKYNKNANDYDDFKENFQYYADIAKGVQLELEKAVLYIVEERMKFGKNGKLAYAGGTALNALVNSLIVKNNLVDELYIQPAAGDNGLAIGCAFYGWLEVLKKERVLHNSSTCFGKNYLENEIEQEIKDYIELFPQKIKYYKSSNITQEAAKILEAGNIIGWFQGGSEFGPRSLGRRSILSDPRRKDVRNIINSKVKFREDFRPFAPSVLKEDAAIYFKMNEMESPYMIMVFDIKDEWKNVLKSVVHENNTSRVQTVTPDWNKKYYELL